MHDMAGHRSPNKAGGLNARIKKVCEEEQIGAPILYGNKKARNRASNGPQRKKAGGAQV